jgi:hypothetical protein
MQTRFHQSHVANYYIEAFSSKRRWKKRIAMLHLQEVRGIDGKCVLCIITSKYFLQKGDGKNGLLCYIFKKCEEFMENASVV